MPQLRIRIIGNQDDLRAVADLLQSIEGIEHVEEINDLMPRMDDPDSSSAGLSELRGVDMHDIEIEVPNASTERKVREAIEALAFDLETVVEFDSDADED